MFSIAQRLVLRSVTHKEPASPSFGGFAEYVVDFFEGAVGGLGVEEVDDWEDEGVSGEVGVSVWWAVVGMGELDRGSVKNWAGRGRCSER